MAAKLISMSKIKQIIRLHLQGKAILTIAQSVGLSKNTVKKYLHFIKENNLSFEQVLSMNEFEVQSMLSKEKDETFERYSDLEKLFPYFEKELNRTGVTRMLLWGEYRTKYPDGYGYSQFCELFGKHLKTTDAVMHFEHIPGDKMFVDFTGKKLFITDAKTGIVNSVEVYVCVLGYSQMTYVEAVASQKKEDFISATQNALLFFGGVPKVIIPDNLKSAVTKAGKYEADLNRSFEDFAEHFGTAVMPTRSCKPRDKALVEKHVNIVYNRIYAPLRNDVFFCLEQLNKAILVLLDKHNKTNFQLEKISREDKFNQFEKSELSALATELFEIKYYKQVTVLRNSHVSISEDKNYYSVPYRYIGKKIQIIYTASSVSVFYKQERIALHIRNLRNFVYTTLKEHLPSSHQFVSDWSPEKFISWASNISTDVKSYITEIISSKIYPEQAYKTCIGILSFAKKYGNERLIKAVKRADSYGVYNYKTIKNILESKLDRLPDCDSLEFEQRIPEHDNIRGKENYK